MDATAKGQLIEQGTKLWMERDRDQHWQSGKSQSPIEQHADWTLLRASLLGTTALPEQSTK
jgi:hypothetical protein